MAAKVGEFGVETQLGGGTQGLELRSSAPGGELMHLKGYCVDHRLLRTGSVNFSRSAEKHQDNHFCACSWIPVRLTCSLNERYRGSAREVRILRPADVKIAITPQAFAAIVASFCKQ